MIKSTGPGDCLTVTGEGEESDKMIARCFDLDS